MAQWFYEMDHSRPLFSLFSSIRHKLNTIDSNKILPLSGFEPQISGVASVRSTN